MRFWKLRQAEYSPYLLQCSPLRVRHVPDNSETTLVLTDCTCSACKTLMRACCPDSSVMRRTASVRA